MYLLNKELRTFAFYLIFNLALCDALQNTFNLIILNTDHISSQDAICQA